MNFCTGRLEQRNIRQEILEKPEVLNILFSTLLNWIALALNIICKSGFKNNDIYTKNFII